MCGTTWPTLLALLMLGLIPLAPKMVELRISVLNWMGLRRIAAFHQSAFEPIVLVVRIVLLALFVILLSMSLGRFPGS